MLRDDFSERPSSRREPHPGTQEALDAGCKCPVLDNGHGRGWMGGVRDQDGEIVYVIAQGCPLHWQGIVDP